MQEGIWDAARLRPGDDGPRTVLADELQSRGDPLGELIALQCRQASEGLAFAPAAAARLHELHAQHGPAFAARFFGEGTCERVVFHRGLPAIVRATAERWLNGPETNLPLVTLELSDVLPRHLAPLLARADTRRLRGLRLRAADTEQWSLDEAQALGHAELPHLEHLALFYAWSNHATALAFCSSPLVSGLTSLELGHSLSSDPVRVLDALAGTARALEEISIDDTLPISIAPLIARCRIVAFPDSFVRPQLAEALAHRVALYLPPHVSSPPTGGGPRVGRWQSWNPLGVRNGLDASLVQEEHTGLEALLLRTRSLSADLSSPRHWLEPGLSLPDDGECALGAIDTGIFPGGEWAVFALAAGERLDKLVEREGSLPLSPAAHAAAWARVARWTAERRLVKAMPLSSLFAGPRGLLVQPVCGELLGRRRGPARYTRREFIELSPEAVRSTSVDEKNATWGLAMQLCLTLGIRVFGDAARTELELLQQIMQGPPIELYGYGLPPKLRDILRASLNRDRTMRPTPAALAEVLAGFESPRALAELARLPSGSSALERAREQAEGWLEGSSVHESEPLT